MIRNEHTEKRTHRRLDVKLALEYRNPDTSEHKSATSTTKNVSTGGLYFETTDDNINQGDVLTFELGIPQKDNRFPQNGTMSTTGEIVRKIEIQASEPNDEGVKFTRFGIAAQFQKNFKLEF